eukprot:gene12454-8911_t
MSRACPMVMEFKLAATDRELMDSLKQVMQRLHLLFSVNCFIKRSFGFAVNGGASSFLVSIHRNLARDQPHWYEDTVHILKIATTHVAGIWNELTKKAQQDLCFVLDRDVFALAATLRAMSQTTAPSASPPPPPPDWDLSRLMGYTKISLKGLSSSRVYGVYPSNVVNERNRTFIRTTVTEPVFLVKTSHSPDRSCREHSALKRLAQNFGSSPWAQLFYVHQSFVFENWVVSDTAAFSSVAVADRPGAIQETCWWNPLLNCRSLPNDTSPVATVVMKHAHRLAFVKDTAFQSVMVRLGKWLRRIHTAGVLHTDLRPSNIMWLPVKSGTVTTEIEKDLTLPVDKVLGSAVSPEGENRTWSCESQFDMELRIEDPPSVAGSCSQDDVVDIPSEITEGASATGRPEATATTEAEETTDNANDAVGVTAAAATDHSVTQELMLPIVIDFDCAELLSEGTNSCEVGISRPTRLWYIFEGEALRRLSSVDKLQALKSIGVVAFERVPRERIGTLYAAAAFWQCTDGSYAIASRQVVTPQQAQSRPTGAVIAVDVTASSRSQALKTTDGFFKKLYTRAKQLDVPPFDLLKRSGTL